MGDAIVRTLVRLYVTRRNLLEWMTAAQAKATHGLGLDRFYRQMAGGVVLAVVSAVLVLVAKPGAGWIALPFIALWLLSPAVARRVSLPARIGAQTGSRPRTRTRCASSRAAPGASSRPSSGPTTTRCRRTTSRKTRRRWSRTARRRPTSACTCSRPLPPATSAGSAPWRWSSVSRRRSRRSRASSGIAATSTTGTTRATCTRSSPRTSRPSTAATSPAHLIALSSACREMIDQPLPVAAALAGIRDAVALTRQAAETIGHDRKGQTLTRRNLEEALAPFEGARR